MVETPQMTGNIILKTSLQPAVTIRVTSILSRLDPHVEEYSDNSWSRERPLCHL